MKKKTPDWFVRADSKVMLVYKAASYIALLCLVAIMLIAFIDVIGEKLSKLGLPVSGIPYYSDWVAYLHVPVVFMSVGFITVERGHTVVDILTSKFHAVIRRITEYFSMILGVAISAFLFYRATWVLLPDIMEHGVTIANSSYSPPSWPFAAVYCIGLLLMTFSFLWALLRLIFNYTPPAPPDPFAPDPDPELKGEEAQ